MHVNNVSWMVDMKAKYPRSFRKARVLELGAEGSWPVVRELFVGGEYIGVDKIGGPNVDEVMLATETDFDPASFDTIVCLSMFEHDPGWRETLSHNLQWLKPGGMMFGCHGAEGNEHHGPEPWQIVPAEEFLTYVKTLPVKVLDSFFEEERYGPDCAGAYDWVLKKEKSDA